MLARRPHIRDVVVVVVVVGDDLADLVSLAALDQPDRLAALEALRTVLAVAIVGAAPREVAALARQLRDTLREIEAAAPAPQVSAVDQLAAARAARQASVSADVGAAAAVGVERGRRSGRPGS